MTHWNRERNKETLDLFHLYICHNNHMANCYTTTLLDLIELCVSFLATWRCKSVKGYTSSTGVALHTSPQGEQQVCHNQG